MSNKAVIAVVAVVSIAVIGFLFYRQTELEDRLVQQQQKSQAESQKLQAELAAKEKEAATLREAQRRVFDRIEAKDRARNDLQTDPSKYVKGGSDWDVLYRGFLTTYARATAIELSNGSQFDVSDIEGKLTYLTAAGTEIATVPFKAEGDVGTGQTKKLKIAATEVTGDAKRGRIHVERVRIIGGSN